jgi:hypothetical protein
MLRSTSSLVVTHDAIGRRIAEYDDFDATRSRRDYTYLPNGQLGGISGQTWSGSSYSVEMRYDERGRPITIAASDLYELYWDESDRLIAAEITFPSARGAGQYVGARWHYHWLGKQLIAATRELVTTQGGEVKRFWAISDERGFVYRLVDEQGATFWQARWDSTGWRTFVGTPQNEMWVPFALPGQILLGRFRTSAGVWSEGTEAFASGTGGTWTRAPLALNRWRVYDPQGSTFLQTDGLDLYGRIDPEGYVAFRNSPVESTDETGLQTESKVPNLLGMTFGVGCSEQEVRDLLISINVAILGIVDCQRGACSSASPGPGMPGLNPSLKRRWVASVMFGKKFDCVSKNTLKRGTLGEVTGGSLMTQSVTLAHELIQTTPCLPGLIAHEALHTVLDIMTPRDLFSQTDVDTSMYSPVGFGANVSDHADRTENRKRLLKYFPGDVTFHGGNFEMGHLFVNGAVMTCFGCEGNELAPP